MDPITFTRGTSFGISLSLDEVRPLSADLNANQDVPRGCYVYGHKRLDGVFFYIGKGTARRAWDDERHPLWHRYVHHHLDGQYRVVILSDGLTSEDAEALENLWVSQESSTLVNWINCGRQYDAVVLDRLHSLRRENKDLHRAAKTAEVSSPDEAIRLYRQALVVADQYADIDYESGLVGQLMREERLEVGSSGDLVALDRLTLCLTKRDRGIEALDETNRYFDRFRADRRLRQAEAIIKRVRKAANKSLERSRDR